MSRIVATLRWKRSARQFIKAAEREIADIIFDVAAEDFPSDDTRHSAYRRRVDRAVGQVFRDHTEFDVREY